MRRRDFSWDRADCGFNGQLQQGFTIGGMGPDCHFAWQQFSGANVCFVPKADICTAVKTSLFDHLVGEDEQLVWNIELNQLCCFAMDDQLELNRLLNWHIGYRPGH